MPQLQLTGTFKATIELDIQELAKLGIRSPDVRLAGAEDQKIAGPSRAAGAFEFPEQWQMVEERPDQTYNWGKHGFDKYDPFVVYEGRTSRGSIRMAIGHCQRTEVWGRDRLYLITFYITAGGKQPLCEFLETDDYQNSRELIAIIRGTGESQRGMYGPEQALPEPYSGFPIEIYSQRVDFKGSWNKQAVLASEDDIATMLNHSLIQADLRFDIRPS